MALTPDVVNGAVVDVPWGTEIRNRTAQVFASTAERDTQWTAPPDGAHCVTVDTHTVWLRHGGTWFALDQTWFMDTTTELGVAPAGGAWQPMSINLPTAKWVEIQVGCYIQTAGSAYLYICTDGAARGAGAALNTINVTIAMPITCTGTIQLGAGSHLIGAWATAGNGGNIGRLQVKARPVAAMTYTPFSLPGATAMTPAPPELWESPYPDAVIYYPDVDGAEVVWYGDGDPRNRGDLTAVLTP